MLKPVKEIVQITDGKEKILLIGCRCCTTVSETRAEEEIKEMAGALSKEGKNVIAAIAPPSAEFTCFFPWSKEHLKPYRQQIEECDAIVMITCDEGFRLTEQWILEGKYAPVKPIYSAVVVIACG